MWLHESESNSIITEAYENKIFLTIIYISNNSPDTLERHIMLSHDDEEKKEGRKKTYPCLNCDYVATRKHDLKGHHWNIHIDIEKEVQPRIVPRCNKCGFTSKWGNIQRHEDKCQFGGVFVYV